MSLYITTGTFAAVGLAILLLLTFVVFPGTNQDALTDQEIFLHEDGDEVGTGYAQIKRDTDIEYTIKKKDTLYELAYLYEVDVDELVSYNDIKDVTKLMPGQKILIPSNDNVSKLQKEQKIAREKEAAVIASKPPVPKPKSVLPSSVQISAEQQSDGQSLTVNFTIDTDIDEKNTYTYIWNFGDGKKAFHKTTRYTYEKPGTYNAYCTIVDKYGYKKDSNRIFIDIPHTGTTKNTKYQFLTLNSTGLSFKTSGPVISINGQPAEDAAVVTLIAENENRFVYRADKAGYFFLVVETADTVQKINLFVSPVASVHSERTDVNWYRTQFNTGTPSNCGPATVSMGISWATGSYVPVSTIRQEVGWSGNGGTNFSSLGQSLKNHGVAYNDREITGADDIFPMIDQDHIVIILHNSGRITSRGESVSASNFGRYYTDSVSHYIIIKGYSTDKKYFIVYDPLPSDWISNSLRYTDGISMLGRNRYYPVSEVIRALRTHRVLEVIR